MFILLLGVVGLILGYVVYSRYVERIFLPFKEPTPAVKINDGVDYVPMPTWKDSMIQLLNIAGTGPIFGALMGAKWGPIVFLWIIFGTILGGAVHDYMSGMMSVREDGASITSVISKYIGKWTRYPILILVVFLMIMVSATFARSASDLLVSLTDIPVWIWMGFILFYFMLSTLLPIDKVIGRIYPVFGVLLIVMALTIIGGLVIGGYEFPSITFENLNPDKAAVLPDMFITVACGAISGFHATQSPMVSRCISDERSGRTVFYGAMAIEAVIALVWATAGLAFYGNTTDLAAALTTSGASGTVYEISSTVAGPVGGVLAVLGVIVCPITSGDTALRAARLMIEDDRHVTKNKKRIAFMITLVMMLFIILLCSLDFTVLWNYFSWLNQTLAAIVLWTATIFIMRSMENKWYSVITMVPAMFMTVVVSSFILHSKLGLNLDYELSVMLGVLLSVVAFVFYLRAFLKFINKE